MPLTVIERRLRVSGLLVAAGLVVQLLTLPWNRPSSFLIFLFVGCPLVGVGIVIYLISLVSNPTR